MNVFYKYLLATLTALTASFYLHAQTDTTTMQEVTVSTGQYKSQSIKNSVYQVRVIDHERIRLSGATNVQQVLMNQLGFRFSNDNTLGVADVELMGMSGRSVKILLDGVPVVDRNDTKESLAQIDINLVERIEIVEGPMSVSYGSDALAGVINIITKTADKNKLFVSARVQEETAGNEYHPFSYKGMHTQSLNANWSKHSWNAMAGLTHNDGYGYGGDTYGRNKPWRPKEQWLGYTRLGYTTKDFSIYYRLDYLDETISKRNPINLQDPTNVNAIDQYFITHRYIHQLQGKWNIRSNLHVSGIASYTNYERATTTIRKNLSNGTEQLSPGAGEQAAAAFDYFIFRPTLVYDISSKLTMQAGLDINREKASGDRIKGSPSINDYALFVSTEIKPTDKINIRPGLRFIKNSVYDAPPVVPSVNTKFVISKQLDLRLTYAYGFRSPALRELYFNFLDANHTIIGNPDLKAETSNSFTGSLSWSPPSLQKRAFVATLAGFYNIFRDQVNYGLSPASGDTTTLINIDKFKTTGITLENKASWDNLTATLGFSYIGRYNSLSQPENDVKEFSFTPEINSNIVYTLKKTKTAFALFYKYTGKRPGYQLNNNVISIIKIQDYNWADFTITQPFFKNKLSINTGIKNLFDIKDIQSGGAASGGAHSTGGAALPIAYGRSFFLGLIYNFNKLL